MTNDENLLEWQLRLREEEEENVAEVTRWRAVELRVRLGVRPVELWDVVAPDALLSINSSSSSSNSSSSSFSSSSSSSSSSSWKLLLLLPRSAYFYSATCVIISRVFMIFLGLFMDSSWRGIFLPHHATSVAILHRFFMTFRGRGVIWNSSMDSWWLFHHLLKHWGSSKFLIYC